MELFLPQYNMEIPDRVNFRKFFRRSPLQQAGER